MILLLYFITLSTQALATCESALDLANVNEPITYDIAVELRYSDLDGNGHVNSAVYLDLVTSSRYQFGRDQLNVTEKELTEAGLGFYMTHSTVNYFQPITRIRKVRIQSFVSTIASNRKRFTVSFVITSEDRSTIFASGVIETAPIDLKSGRVMALPEFANVYFF